MTTEDPAKGFKPDYGLVTTCKGASGFDIRLDAVTFMNLLEVTSI